MEWTFGLRLLVPSREVNLDGLRFFDQWEILECNGQGHLVWRVEIALIYPFFLKHFLLLVILCSQEYRVQAAAAASARVASSTTPLVFLSF